MRGVSVGDAKADAELVWEGPGAGLHGEVTELAEAGLEPGIALPREDYFHNASRPHPVGIADQDSSRLLDEVAELAVESIPVPGPEQADQVEGALSPDRELRLGGRGQSLFLRRSVFLRAEVFQTPAGLTGLRRRLRSRSGDCGTRRSLNRAPDLGGLTIKEDR